MTGASIVFGILFIPTNRDLISEGPIAGSPDLSYRYDSDMGTLQIRQDLGSLGSIILTEAHIGTDGLFRDAEGNVIGRDLSGSGVVADAGVLPGHQTPAETDQDQPNLCPDPNAENIASRSERSLAYQEQITACRAVSKSRSMGPGSTVASRRTARCWRPRARVLKK
jgi:hypothetical protein